MKHPILSPESGHLLHNNIQTLRDVWEVEDPTTFPNRVTACPVSAIPIKRSLKEQSFFQPYKGELRHA